jgi:two-component system LytT family sensor kinase
VQTTSWVDHPDPEAPPSAGSPRALAPVGREALFWSLHLGFWVAVFGLLLVVREVYEPRLAEPRWLLAARVAACLAATAGMRWLSQRPRLLERLGVSRAGLVAGGLLSAAVFITLAFTAAGMLVAPGFERPTRGRLVANLAVNVSLLANWCALYFGLQLIRERSTAEFRAVEAESAALRSELSRLQAQISPHFLFNALNTVLASRDDPEAIETVTQALAKYLRFLLRPAARLEPLSQELEAMEQYLTVQGIRFGAALETRIDCDLEVRGVLVPPALVQPLVENALKYGGEPGGGPLRVEVSARRAGDWLEVEVANNGRWLPPGHGGSTGTGLDSLAGRLRLVIGPDAGLSHREADGMVRVRVRIPLEPEGSRA